MDDWNAITQGIAVGDSTAFRTCFDLLHQDIYGYAYRYFKSKELAEDVVQDVFGAVWAHRHSLDANQGIKAYIYRIARNTIFNQLKRATYDQDMRAFVCRSQSAQHNELEEGYFFGELQGLYEEAVSKLPSQRQLVFRLSRNEGLSHEEIAERLAISKNTVKDQIVKASAFIRKYVSANMREHVSYTVGLAVLSLFSEYPFHV